MKKKNAKKNVLGHKSAHSREQALLLFATLRSTCSERGIRWHGLLLNIEDVCKRVQEITGIEVNTEDDVNEALDLFNEKHEDEDMFYYLHKFECGED